MKTPWHTNAYLTHGLAMAGADGLEKNAFLGTEFLSVRVRCMSATQEIHDDRHIPILLAARS